MKCAEAREIILNGEKTGEGSPVSSHIAACPNCGEFARKNALLEKQIHSFCRDVDVPPGLKEKLEARIDDLGEKQKWRNVFPWFLPSWSERTEPSRRWTASLAALAVLLIFVATFLSKSGDTPDADSLLALALKSHMTRMPMEFQAGGNVDITGWFQDKLGFKVFLPQTMGGLPELAGGRKCRLGSNEVAYLFYGTGAGRTSLFILGPNAVALPVREDSPVLTEAGDYRITAWKEKGLVYIAVGPKGGDGTGNR